MLKFENENGWKLPNRSQDSLSTGLVYANREIGLTASLDVTYYGVQYGVDRVSGSSDIESQKKLEDVGDAWVADLSFSKRLFNLDKWGDVRLRASIHNLFDVYYSNNEDSWMPGRSFYMGLEYKY